MGRKLTIISIIPKYFPVVLSLKPDKFEICTSEI
ncbi:hypothetical protein BH09BAC5_BH09BAC5_26990 [soil metagenome]